MYNNCGCNREFGSMMAAGTTVLNGTADVEQQRLLQRQRCTV